MNHFNFELSLIAVLPALLLCGYVFYKDRIEKEPVGLLALLFGVGAAAYIPARLLQEVVLCGIDAAFAKQMTYSAEGILTYATDGAQWLHLTLCALIGYSLTHIVVKWLALFLVTRRNKHFNYLFDGVVYATFLSLGFALAEVLHFAINNNAELTLVKFITCVPFNLFVGILMGYFYT